MKLAEGVDSVLEFGPGNSTLAFIEAGVKRIVTCEYLDPYFDQAVEQFKPYPQVEVRRFQNAAPEALVDGLKGEFDIAFVDSPKGYAFSVPGRPGQRVALRGQEDCSRLNTCLAALKYAPIVYLDDACRPLERGTLGRLNRLGHKVEYVYIDKDMRGIAKIERHA